MTTEHTPAGQPQTSWAPVLLAQFALVFDAVRLTPAELVAPAETRRGCDLEVLADFPDAQALGEVAVAVLWLPDHLLGCVLSVLDAALFTNLGN